MDLDYLILLQRITHRRCLVCSTLLRRVSMSQKSAEMFLPRSSTDLRNSVVSVTWSLFRYAEDYSAERTEECSILDCSSPYLRCLICSRLIRLFSPLFSRIAVLFFLPSSSTCSDWWVIVPCLLSWLSLPVNRSRKGDDEMIWLCDFLNCSPIWLIEELYILEEHPSRNPFHPLLPHSHPLHPPHILTILAPACASLQQLEDGRGWVAYVEIFLLFYGYSRLIIASQMKWVENDNQLERFNCKLASE